MVRDVKFITELVSNSLIPYFKTIMLAKVLLSETGSINFFLVVHPTENEASFAALNKQLGPATISKVFHTKLTYIFKMWNF